MVDYVVEKGEVNGWRYTRYKSGSIEQVKTVTPTSQYSSFEPGIQVHEPSIVAHGVQKAIQNLKVIGIQFQGGKVWLECTGAQVDGTSYVKIVIRS
ncbi:MAG: hypothetical protein ACRC92_14025 [Peptostreptococcaceae bacterium]